MTARWQQPSMPKIPMLKKLLEKEGLDCYESRDAPRTRYGEFTHPYDEIRWFVNGRLQVGVSGKMYLLGLL